MPFLFRTLLIFATLIADMTILGHAGGSLMSPDATLMLVVAWTLLFGFSESIGWTLFAGVLADVVLFRPFGFSILVFVLASYGAGFVSKRFFEGHPLRILVPFLGIILFSAGVRSVVIIVSLGVGEGMSLLFSWIFDGNFFERIALVSVSAFLFFLSYTVLDRAEKFFSYYQRRVQPMGRYMK